jgi:hypothetical protein
MRIVRNISETLFSIETEIETVTLEKVFNVKTDGENAVMIYSTRFGRAYAFDYRDTEVYHNADDHDELAVFTNAAELAEVLSTFVSANFNTGGSGGTNYRGYADYYSKSLTELDGIDPSELSLSSVAIWDNTSIDGFVYILHTDSHGLWVVYKQYKPTKGDMWHIGDLLSEGNYQHGSITWNKEKAAYILDIGIQTSVDKVQPDINNNVPLTWIGTRQELNLLEDPAGSGKYPSLLGKYVIVTDEYNTTNLLPTPDHANRETTNLYPTKDVYYTITKTGYLYIACNSSGNAAWGAGGSCAIWINDKVVTHSGTYTAGVTATTASRQYYSATIPVVKGDILRITTVSGTILYDCSAYFVPIRWNSVVNPNVLVEYSYDYTPNTELPVLIKDSATNIVRQKKDVDGKLIWRQTFTGYRVVALNTTLSFILLGGVYRLLKTDGWWMPSDANTYKLPPNSYRSAGFIEIPAATNMNKSSVELSTSNNLYFHSASNANATGTNCPYQITVEYTKI